MWCGVNWYEPFAITLNGAAVDLTTYTAVATVDAYAGGPAAFPMSASIDTPKTNGTGLLTVLGSDTATVAPGIYVYKVVLTPASPSVSVQPIIIYGNLELRTR